MLSRQLERKRGAEATKKVEEFDRYLVGLAAKDQLTADGQQQIAAVLSAVHAVVAPS